MFGLLAVCGIAAILAFMWGNAIGEKYGRFVEKLEFSNLTGMDYDPLQILKDKKNLEGQIVKLETSLAKIRNSFLEERKVFDDEISSRNKRIEDMEEWEDKLMNSLEGLGEIFGQKPKDAIEEVRKKRLRLRASPISVGSFYDGGNDITGQFCYSGLISG